MMDDSEWKTRVVVALETLVQQRSADQRLEDLQELLEEFVRLMGEPRSSDEEWQQLLTDTKEALEIE